MCGIGGYICFGPKRPVKSKIETIFVKLQSRGGDSAGYAFIENNRLIVHKAAIKAQDFVQTKFWTALSKDSMPSMMIFHTRASTKGSKENNMNNHPIYNKEGFCIVHNGIIWNDDEIYRKHFPDKRDAEVDSEVILTLWSESKDKDKISTLFKHLRGSFSVAIIDAKKPNELTLVKKDNPLNLFYDFKDDILYFGSNENHLVETLYDNIVYRRGIPFRNDYQTIVSLSDKSGVVINSTGIKSIKEYVVNTKYDYSKYDYPKYSKYDYPKYNKYVSAFDYDDYDSALINPKTESCFYVKCNECGEYNYTTKKWMNMNTAYCSNCANLLNLNKCKIVSNSNKIKGNIGF